MPDNQLVLYRNNPVNGPRNSIASLFGRVLGARLDLRRGGLLPEELPRDQAERLMALLKSRLAKQVDPRTGEATFVLSRVGVAPAAAGEPCLANLCRAAQTMLSDALRALEPIHALDPDGDPELVEARKAILESEFKALMHELCQQQPRVFQIEVLLREALTNVGQLAKDCGTDSVNTPEEDRVVINLRVLNDYLSCLELSFFEFKDEHFSLNCLLQEITFALQTIGETVSQARAQLLEDGVTEADLRVLRLKRPDTRYVRTGRHGSRDIAETITADAFLSLNEYEAERMIQVVERGGKIGAQSIKPYINRIVYQFHETLGPPGNYEYLRHLTGAETFNLFKIARGEKLTGDEAKAVTELRQFRTTASPTVFEFIKRYPSTLFFLFKLQTEWEEVLERVYELDKLSHIVTLSSSDQGAIQQ